MNCPPTDDSSSTVLRVPADPSQLAKVRHEVGQSARELSAEPDIADDLSLVVSELMTNAIQHSGDSDVTVLVQRQPGAWAVEVSGATADLPVTGQRPETSVRSGRGLFIVGAIMDEVELVRRGDGVRVRCTKFA